MADAMYYEVGSPSGDVESAKSDAMYYEVGGSESGSLLEDPEAAFALVLE